MAHDTSYFSSLTRPHQTVMMIFSTSGRKCGGSKLDGTPCGTAPLKGTKFCRRHTTDCCERLDDDSDISTSGRKCDGSKLDGTPCGAAPLKGTKFCRHHKPCS